MTLVTAWLALPHPVEPLCSPYRCCSIAPCPEQGLLAVHEAAGGAKRTPRSPLLLEPGGGEKKEHFNKLLPGPASTPCVCSPRPAAPLPFSLKFVFVTAELGTGEELPRRPVPSLRAGRRGAAFEAELIKISKAPPSPGAPNPPRVCWRRLLFPFNFTGALEEPFSQVRSGLCRSSGLCLPNTCPRGSTDPFKYVICCKRGMKCITSERVCVFMV